MVFAITLVLTLFVIAYPTRAPIRPEFRTSDIVVILAPTACTWIIVAILALRVVGPRSPLIPLLGLIATGSSCLGLWAVARALRRLITFPANRIPRNYVVTVLGASGLFPGAWALTSMLAEGLHR
jgi:hypothetical protein